MYVKEADKRNLQGGGCLCGTAGGTLPMPLQYDPARYVAYTFFEWLEDDYFRQWVRTPSPESDAFFNALRIWYPEKERDLADARMLLGLLSRPNVDALPEIEVRALWHRIKRSITTHEVTQKKGATIDGTPCQ